MKKIYLEKKQLALIAESISKNVYHFTDEDGIEYICKNNELPLTKFDKYRTNDIQNDENISDGYEYYLSLTRVKNKQVGYQSWKFTNSIVTARIEFDGDMLNNNFAGKAVDYFKVKGSLNPTPYSSDSRFVQSEDRLYSKKQVLSDIYKYIVRIDLLLNDSNDIEWFKRFVGLLRDTNFSDKIVPYINEKDFNFQK